MIRFKIHRYYGGEYPEDITFAKTYEEALQLGQQSEHWEITKLKQWEEEPLDDDEEDEVIYSCCGDEMTIELIDYGRCPTCKEHCV